MRIDVHTIFPGLVRGFVSEALLGRAGERGLLDVRCHDLREHTSDPHRTVDDKPFGGGAGMVLLAEPLLASFAAAHADGAHRPRFVLGPAGRQFDQRLAEQLAAGPGFSLVCGRYEGVDDRVVTHACDGELSIGDYVLSGGEAAACVVIEAVARLVPGVMGNAASAGIADGEESHGGAGLLEHPQHTRPASLDVDGVAVDVPDVLRSGDHARVARWRRAMALVRTAQRRPDLWAARGGSGALTAADVASLIEAELLDRLSAADPSVIEAAARLAPPPRPRR